MSTEREELRELAEHRGAAEPIRCFEDIPDLLRLKIEPVEYLVDGLIARKTITHWAGVDGTAKTYLIQHMALSVAKGGCFLGRSCHRAAVLYLDYENPSFAVKERLELLTSEAESLPASFKVWGPWLEQQPPQISSELLLQIVKQVRPLLVIDPFRYAHGADENDSGQMMVVMRDLRTYAAAGAAVVVLHHPAKAEHSTGRGSSVIRGAADVSVMQEMSMETGLITLKWVKNRFGEKPIVTVRPDFDTGTFEVTDSPAFLKRVQQIQSLREHIEATPGLSTNQLYKLVGGKRTQLQGLLKDHAGRQWRSESGPKNSTLYFPLVPAEKEPLGTTVPLGGGVSGTCGSSLREEEPRYHSRSHTGGSNGNYSCNVHPKNQTNWWLRGEDPVCGFCHPEPARR